MLAAYDYSIRYRTSSDNANADCLSRLPLKCHSDGYDRSDHVEIFLNCMIEQLPLTAQQVKTYTRNDPLLTRFLMLPWMAGSGNILKTLI